MSLAPISSAFHAQKNADNGNVNITVSSDLASMVATAAPFAGAILAAYSAPFFFAVATAGGFILADQLAFANYQIDKIWHAQTLPVQILASLAAVVAIFLTPILSAIFAGQRAGAWLRDNGPLVTNPHRFG